MKIKLSNCQTVPIQTLWRSLQGFWRVEAIKYDLDTTFFAPEDPNFIEIHGDTILQFYLVNAPKSPVSVPNRGWFDGGWEGLKGVENKKLTAIAVSFVELEGVEPSDPYFADLSNLTVC